MKKLSLKPHEKFLSQDGCSQNIQRVCFAFSDPMRTRISKERFVDDSQSGLLRRKFSAQEDQKLRNLVDTMGTKSWEAIAKFMGDRTARQCRDRFKNYLLDHLITEPWTPEEDAIVIQQFQLIGPKWADIGKLLSGRSGNNVKNRWHKHLHRLYKAGHV
jgi:hypothetical protein